jgi:hypothetical protein
VYPADLAAVQRRQAKRLATQERRLRQHVRLEAASADPAPNVGTRTEAVVDLVVDRERLTG